MVHQLRVKPGHVHELALKKGEFLRLENAKGWTLKSVSGDLLLTAYRDPKDHLIGPQEGFILPSNRLVLVEAIGTTRIELAHLAVPTPHTAAFEEKLLFLYIEAARHSWLGLIRELVVLLLKLDYEQIVRKVRSYSR